MRPRVYLETTIPSYLTARPSRDVVRLGHELATRSWWDARRQDYELVVSDLVEEECAGGDPAMAAARLETIAGCGRLAVTPAAEALMAALLSAGSVPVKAPADALHIALSCVHRCDILLTWNCTHIANRITGPRVEELCRRHGHRPPLVCTPLELLENGL